MVGPVTVTGVSPMPGPANANQDTGTVKSIYGTTAMIDDRRMRNGSMIVLRASADQGYDSRVVNYDPLQTVSFPCALQPDRALISTSSNHTSPVEVLHQALMWPTESRGALALKSAAVLTCVAQVPPADAFRPAYAGTIKPLYRASAIQWERLSQLAPPTACPVPDWAQLERYFQRPWLDHIDSWLLQHMGPSENQVNYGREFSRINSIASLMLLLDVPREKNEKLLLGFLQWGIDLAGLVHSGRRWFADGGHWNGRKWPILFAGMLLGDANLQALPASPDALFSEDQQTYYGRGWKGQTALYQMVWHTFPRTPYEEKAPEAWDASDRLSEGYRATCSVGWPGTALAALLMNAKALWNHDAFFDYCDRWMEHDTFPERKCLPVAGSAGHADPFVEAMWHMYRAKIPNQPRGSVHRKWVWIDLEKRLSKFISNQSGE